MLIPANIFQPLIDVFESVLKFYHSFLGGSWGWSIILLTITVRALLVPLTVKQIKSMARMQTLQPELKEIQSRYKEDKQRQQQEMMKFYKENNVNPLSSCLPLVAQLPVFISLYYMLRRNLRADICPAIQPKLPSGAVDLAHTVPCGPHNGANFLFIHDLTNKATGITLIVLIVLYVGSQLGSTLVMSGATMDPTQRKLMLFMPLVFVLFVIRFPAGVLVYWITTNLWTVGQQYIVRRRIGPVRPATATAAAGNGGGRASPARSSAGNGKPKESAPASSGGLLGAIRNASKPAGTSKPAAGSAKRADTQPEKKSEKKAAPVATGARSGPPPRSPRKKKKRSGRRR
ncbi:MAG: membrane protein insertase YidC [Solirubrobacteraceae bacterium]